MGSDQSVQATFKDTTPPGEQLNGKGTQDVDKLKLTITSNEQATLAGQASVALPKSGKLAKAKVVKSKIARGSVGANQRTVLRFKYAKKPLKLIKNALYAHKKLKAKIVVTATDTAGNAAPASKSVKLIDK